MKTTNCLRIALILALISVPSALVAGDEHDSDKKNGSMFVVGDGDDETSIIFEDGMLTIISQDGDDTSTQIIDMEAMGTMATEVADEVLSEMHDVIVGLDDMQFQFRMGQDNRLNLSFEDSEFELDLDAIMSQVSVAMSSGMAEFETSDWTSHGDRDELSDDELRAELHDLKVELQELRHELQQTAKQLKKSH